MSFAKTVWNTLSAIDCSKHVEKKGNLSYLSWAWAWGILMTNFPESEYDIEPPVTATDDTVMCWVSVTVKSGDQALKRRMWLPAMDHRNNAIKNPDMRKISDTQMRCLTKCLAMFGLGHYIYAGEDIPDPEAAERAKHDEYVDLVAENQESIKAIKEGIANDDWSSAAEAWFELSDEVKRGLWKAPSNGGCFTTQERAVMQKAEFRKAFFGDE